MGEADDRAVEPLGDRRASTRAGASLRDRLEPRARELVGRHLEHARGCGVDRGDDAVRVAREDAVADGVERHRELVQREALLRARPQAAEGERDVLGQQVGDGLVLLAELAAAAQLVGVEDAVDLAAADGDGDARAAERLARRGGEGCGRTAARCGRFDASSLIARHSSVIPQAGSPTSPTGTSAPSRSTATTTRSASSSCAARVATMGGSERLVGRRVDLAEDVEQDAQAIALEERRADELDQVAHRLVEIRRRPAWPAPRARARPAARPRCRGASAVTSSPWSTPTSRSVSARSVACATLESALTSDPRARSKASMRVTVSSVITRSKTRRPKARKPVRMARRSRHVAAGPSTCWARPSHTAADSSPIAAGARREELGEADHRAPLAAPQPRLVEARDGAAEARARLLRVSGVGGVAGGLDLERRDQALRTGHLDDLVRLGELGVRRRPCARLRGPPARARGPVSAASSRRSSGSSGSSGVDLGLGRRRGDDALGERASRASTSHARHAMLGGSVGQLARGRQACPGGRVVVARERRAASASSIRASSWGSRRGRPRAGRP